MDPTSTQLLKLLELSIARINHLEQLLVALAGIGMTGWAFLHANPLMLSDRKRPEVSPSKVVFAIIFAGAIATAFNGIFVGRMGVNIVLLQLEHELNPPITPYLNFFKNTGFWAAPIYLATAAFVPIMSVASLLYTYGGIRSVSGFKRKKVVSLLWIVTFVLIVGTFSEVIVFIVKTRNVAMSYVEKECKLTFNTSAVTATQNSK